ncbi:fibrocystin-L-like isoform X3 [Ruditapes philippinarum]|nr:fibrocystin-L-like isoform X3 [Ruditapes philippinarum]
MALDNGGGSGVLMVTRISQASPPVNGLVELSLNGLGLQKDIEISQPAANFQRELESIQGMGSVNVVKKGDGANFELTITFLSLPGDLPPMTVLYDRVLGKDVQIIVETKVDGGLFYDPLTGDMVSTVHSSPQVRLFINDIPTACTDDCSFNWDSSSTPTISGISPQSGSSSISTTAFITGTGFSTVISNNQVIIGGVECTVTGSLATIITCDVGNGPVGPHSVVVTVDGKGNPEGSVQFTYTAGISSLAPTSGSLGGGGKLTISGFGFKNGANVTINSKNCLVVSIQADAIVCLVPQSTSAGTYDVVVDQESSSLSYSGYTYNSGLTALVSSIVPSTIDVTGENIIISGSSFSPSKGSVFVGSVEAAVTSWSDSQIVISVHDVLPGIQQLRIEAPNGYAVKANTFELPTVNVDLKITNVYPLQGSLLGGTKLTITGSGFGTDDNAVVVKIGDVNCEILSLTNTQILCQIEDLRKIHQVTNMGVDPDFGVYYAYDKPFITINEGDFVNWSWKTAAFVTDVTHSVTEIENPGFLVAKKGGFSSGSPSRDGSFRHQFVKAGLYYVWSGMVSIYNNKYYIGQIKVVPAITTYQRVNVILGKAWALSYRGGSSNPIDGSNCQSVTSGKQSCSDNKLDWYDLDKFIFTFWTCSTPVVNSINVNSGTTKTDIVITGEGFSNTECQNEVSFGGIPCIVKSSSEDTLTCNLENSGEPELGILHQIDMRVHNRGKARINIVKPKDRGFAVIPNIEQITPTSGSLAGGALLTVSGYGFGESPMVEVDGYQCKIITNTYKEIVCETPRHTIEGEKHVTVEAFVNGASHPAKCETYLKKCRFLYARLYTSTVSSISPSSMSGATSFTINGTALGTNIGEVSVSIGNVIGTVTSVDVTVLVVDVNNIPAGDNDVFVYVKDYGKASGRLSVFGNLMISQISPSSGSIYGNTKITIQGNGFFNTASVTIGGAACDIESISLSVVICVTKAHAAGSTTVVVTSNSISESSIYTYAASSTPTITSLNPTFGVAGQTLTITGSNLSGGNVAVTIGQSSCDYISGNAGEIKCTIGDHPTGMANVLAHVAKLGYSNSNIQFEYQLSIDSIHPIRGGKTGRQIVVIAGTGFDDSAVVTICGETCQQTLVTTSSYTCKTPASLEERSCDVSITLNGLTKTLSNAYTYVSTLTSYIQNVSPRRGGTEGGTMLTITGSYFGTVPGNVKVEIDGTVCVVSSVVDTEIECVTGPHRGSINTKVDVEVSGNGIAGERQNGDADFLYIDVWSSLFTWGGGPLPQAGESVIVSAGMTLLLDMDTPVLSFLFIQGGQLIFDEKNIELQANIIMITDGGLLRVGTKDKPFEHKAIITLHGHHKSKELPVYGTKVLAVRNGTLDLHGKEVPLTWTRLASSSASGSNTLELVDPVEWNVGDEIVIASTGHRQSQKENEKKRITAISQNKQTLTLDSALESEHVGVEETFDGTLVEMRGEVGLLTHNVVVRGNQDPHWQDEIKACPAGFNMGEFATQTCFQGRFGDEIGSSQFGATILVHAPVHDTHEAQAHISYVEVTFAGQAFRLGRHPIHFHLNGDMSTSYVRGCSIHKTFNRAVNIHGTHNTLVEKTVIYDIMGGGFFLEDGIETGNTLQYNLAVFVIGSLSLLNDDVTPASYWITNPYNTIQHNAAAGGTHFGYWYIMYKNPIGASYDLSVCPKTQPLGIFKKNSAHSFGRFGLWIFESYYPVQDGCLGKLVEPAVFESFFAWNNDKGAESAWTGALQFVDFVLVQNRLAGYESKSIAQVPRYMDDSPMVKDSLIIGKTSIHPNDFQGCTVYAIIFPMGHGFRVVNTRFVNFAENCYVFGFAKIDLTCTLGCGGFTYYIESLKYVNAPKKASYGWEWEGIIFDKDGTTTGKSGKWTILPTSATIPSDCEAASEFSFGLPGSMCPPQYKWHRFAFYLMSPNYLQYDDFTFANQYGISSVPYREKRVTTDFGWSCVLLSGATYKFDFNNGAKVGNLRFEGHFENFGPEDYIFVELGVLKAPDRFTIDHGKTFIDATVGGIDPLAAKDGDWEWDNANRKIKFIVSGRHRTQKSVVDNVYYFHFYKCQYDNCVTPPDPCTVPPAPTRPLNYDYWHEELIWELKEDGYVTNDVVTGTQVPQDYDNVRILIHTWVMVNLTSINKIGILLIEGVLELADHPSAQYVIEADFIVIKCGRLIVGWPNDPFDGIASIILHGNDSSPYYSTGGETTLGSKAIGVFGGLDLFGKDVGTTWTELAATVNAGSNTITLKEQVQWSVDDEIVVGSTSFNAWQTESFKITAIASDTVTLTLNETLKYKHIAHKETLANGLVISMGAAVGLLSHNIKIIGEDYDKLYTESYGARVLVGLVKGGKTHTGYARLSNVEFYHTGQEGYTDEYDPRFSVAFVAVGTVSDIRPSIVTKCSFHNGFNTAIGAFGTSSLNIMDNVVFGSIGNGIVTSSDDTVLKHNLVSLMVATNSYQDRFEEFYPRWEAGIEAMSAKRLILQDNLVTASERIAYHIAPLECDDNTGNHRNNRMYANILGAVVLPDDPVPADCAKLSGFIAWKNHDFGIYYQSKVNFVSENNLLIENSNGLLAIVNGPAILSHVYADKRVEIKKTTFVGQTSSFDCANDRLPSPDNNTVLSANSRPSSPPNGDMVGLVFPNYISESNKAPLKPFKGLMSYNAIGGLTTISDVTFAKYGQTACKNNYAVTTNEANDDLQHPMTSERTTLIDVDSSHKIIYHRPNVGKINSADCVDMDCDALKKAMYKDLDGTFLGHVGTVIPQSEYEWGGDPRRGLGDYRIPKEMVTTVDGTRIPYNDIAPYKGIIRSENCKYVSNWQAYECFDDMNYEMLVIESMDSDTETRRLSPVAILGDGYIDLINGPQDHGLCSEYTCRKRVSTFHALVATDHEYLMHFTSIIPKHMRYRLLNVNANEGIKLTVWCSRPNRLDVFVNGQFKTATNVRIDSNNRYITSMPQGNEYDPQIADGTGTNYFDKHRKKIKFIIMGPEQIDIISPDTIIMSISLPTLTVDDFNGDNLVENLAALLNIPPTKVIILNFVSDGSGGTTVEVEIGDEPASDLHSTVADHIDHSSLLKLAVNIVNECQAGNVSQTLNITGKCKTVEYPSTDLDVASIKYVLPTPHHLFFHTKPVADYEGILLITQPKVRVADISNNVVTELGIAEYPWQMMVSVRQGTGHPSNILSGILEVTCSDGWFNFSDLAFSHTGIGYILDFNITYPPQSENFVLATEPFNIGGRGLEINLYEATSGDITTDSQFSIILDLHDSETSETITDISWRNHTWTASVSMISPSNYSTLGGTTTISFDPNTGRVMFPDLLFTGFGTFCLQFRVVSDPPDFNMTMNHKIIIKHPKHIDMIVEETYKVMVKFNVDFNEVLPDVDKHDAFEQMILTNYANMLPDVLFSNASIYEGSIVVNFTMSGLSADLNSTVYSLCEIIYNEMSYEFYNYSLKLSPYMTVKNETYEFEFFCGKFPDDKEDEGGMELYVKVTVVVVPLPIVGVALFLFIWRCKVKPKTQTHDVQSVTLGTLHSNAEQSVTLGTLHSNAEQNLEHYLFCEGSSAGFSGSRPPTATGMIPLLEERPLSSFSVRVSTPDPMQKGTVNDGSMEDDNNISPLPPSCETPVMYLRSPSPNSSLGRESPLPPVGSDYTTINVTYAPLAATKPETKPKEKIE